MSEKCVIRLLYYLPMEMTPDTTDFNSLSKKQLVELVVAKYNDCFSLEEENKKLKEELKELKEYSVKLTGMAVTYNSVKEREEKQKEQIEKCKLVLLGINEKLIEEIFGED